MNKSRIAIILVLLFFVAPFCLMALDNRPVIVLHDYGVRSPAYRGNPLFLEWEVTELRDCEGRVTRTYNNNGVLYQSEWVSTVVHNNVGKGKIKYTKEFRLPDYWTGEISITSHVERWCNIVQEYIPFFRIVEQTPSKTFIIFDSKEP